jgi:hypothetical protein
MKIDMVGLGLLRQKLMPLILCEIESLFFSLVCDELFCDWLVLTCVVVYSIVVLAWLVQFTYRV